MSEPDPFPNAASSKETNAQLLAGAFWGETVRKNGEALASSRRSSRSSAEMTLGKYQILGKIGEGGLGEVYAAIHVPSGVKVALKVLHLQAETTSLLDRVQLKQKDHSQQRLVREIHAAASVQSEHVVAAFDAGESKGISYFVMEWLDGLDTAQILRRIKQIPLADACEIIRQAALGLSDIQRFGFVHRDIKPSNLMVTREGRLKILDLGLSRAALTNAQTDLTQAYSVLGTADYISPEQSLDARSADIRSDIYSLGCAFFKILTGRAPYATPENETTQQQIQAHLKAPIPSTVELRSDVPAEIDALVTRMLAKSPADRPQTPLEIAQALVPWCSQANLSQAVHRAKDHPTLLFGDEEEPNTISLQEGISSVSNLSPLKAIAKPKVSRRTLLTTIGVTTAAASLGVYAWSRIPAPLTIEPLKLHRDHTPESLLYDQATKTLRLKSPSPQLIRIDSHAPETGVIQLTMAFPDAAFPWSVRAGVFLGLRPTFAPVFNNLMKQIGTAEQLAGQFIMLHAMSYARDFSGHVRLSLERKYQGVGPDSTGKLVIGRQYREGDEESMRWPGRSAITLRLEYSPTSLTRVSVDGMPASKILSPATNKRFSRADFATPMGIFYEGGPLLKVSDLFFGSA